MDIANVTEILSAILSHQSLPSTMQMIADAFVALCPSNGVAIFLLSGPQFRMEAEAGLPQRLPGKVFPMAPAFGLREAPSCDFPALRQILDSGVRLCHASPLMSCSGDAKGAFTVFARQQGNLDDPTRETIQSLCGLARLAIEHGRMYEEVVHRSDFDSVTGDTADLILRNTETPLHAAKRAAVGQVQIYSPALGRQSRRAAEMVDGLLNAVAQAQFHIAYQPIYTIDKQIVGFEALLRWNHPTWGQVSPVEFIPAAEKSGLIVAIGDWVIEEVCRQAIEWNAAAVSPVKIFANVSGVQLERPDFVLKIANALARSGLAPQRLELEITESWIISDLRGAAAKLQKLRDLGIGIAIDDFGTGYSTFNYLQELPLDTLKIDRSFIHRLDGSATNLATVRAIVVLAQQLGLKTVAEGVESEQQIRQLNEIGCELVQGFFLARPLKPEAACLLLRKRPSSVPLRECVIQ